MVPELATTPANGVQPQPAVPAPISRRIEAPATPNETVGTPDVPRLDTKAALDLAVEEAARITGADGVVSRAE